MLSKILYLNGRRGRAQADLLLQLGAELEADVVVVAEEVQDVERRNQHGAYDLRVNTKYLGVYTRKDCEIKCRKRGRGEWVEIGGNVGAGYFPPQWDHHKVSNTMRGIMNEMDVVIGDFNCCGGSKKKALEGIITELEFDDIGTTQHTHKWGRHKCRIDRVLAKSGGSLWAIKEGWGCLSDHAAVEAKVKLRNREAVKLTRTNWKKVEEYVEREKKSEEEGKGKQRSGHEYEFAGQAGKELVRLLKEEWSKTVEVCSRSKRWWRQEFKELRKKAAKDKGARKLFKKKIKEAKAEQWRKFVEEGEDVWRIARVAQNPFNLKERCGSLQTEDGKIIEEHDEAGKCEAFLQHNIICGEPNPDTERRDKTRRVVPREETRAAVRTALSRTKNTSAAGPDGVTWRLLKIVKDTRLGRAVLEDVGMVAQLDINYYGETEDRGMTIVIIPKPGKDHSKVKGWRPIVLLNVLGKLADKVVAHELGKRRELFHKRAFAGRKGRGAIDSVMLMDQIRKETGGEVYGRDIKSAFNSLDRETVRKVLEGHEDAQQYVDHFLRPRNFEVKVDGKRIGEGTMVGGTPQGSPLSPALFMIYMSAMVHEAEEKLKKAEEDGRHKMSTRGGGGKGGRGFAPLSYIDDVNSVRVGPLGPMDEVLEATARDFHVQWDRSKDWKNGVHLGVDLRGKKHWKFRTGRAEAAFNVIRRLTRLPPEEKRKVVIGKLLPILTYGSELHQHPTEEASRLVRRVARWVAMGYQGSNEDKIEDETGIGKLEVLTHRKRVRWAASVYARDEPELRPIAERILREELEREEDVILRWRGEDLPIKRPENPTEKGIGFTDGSRVGGVAAAATAEGAIFLGTLATVMDAEVLGIAGAWEEGYKEVRSDSQAAIKRCQYLLSGAQKVRSWIDERIVRAAGEGVTLEWVKGHSGVEGNEQADRRAREGVEKGVWRSDPSLATPAGIRQAYPLFQKKKHMKWDRDEVRGLTYLHTDKGPHKHWMFKIGRAGDSRCGCGETQNAVHLLTSRCVGGKKRQWEEIWEDRAFWGEVTGFLRNQGAG